MALPITAHLIARILCRAGLDGGAMVSGVVRDERGDVHLHAHCTGVLGRDHVTAIGDVALASLAEIDDPCLYCLGHSHRELTPALMRTADALLPLVEAFAPLASITARTTDTIATMHLNMAVATLMWPNETTQSFLARPDGARLAGAAQIECESLAPRCRSFLETRFALCRKGTKDQGILSGGLHMGPTTDPVVDTDRCLVAVTSRSWSNLWNAALWLYRYDIVVHAGLTEPVLTPGQGYGQRIVLSAPRRIAEWFAATGVDGIVGRDELDSHAALTACELHEQLGTTTLDEALDLTSRLAIR